MAKTARFKPAPAEYKSLDPCRDLTTKNGTSRVIQLTVEEYLTRLNVWDGTTVGELITDAQYQRGILDINTNKIKQKMFYDLIRGGTLPPLIVHDKGNHWDIIDGQQRTSVIAEVLKTIRIMELGNQEEKVKKFASIMIEDMGKNGQTILTSDDFLAQPIVVQLWSDLKPDELTELFMLLNHSQQRVSNRHLLEISRTELEQMFVDWGLPVSTQRSEKEHPGHRGRRSKAEIAAHPELVKPHTFRSEYLINGAIAYAAHDQHTKTSTTLHEDDTKFNEHIATIRSENCEHDFKWVCLQFNDIMQMVYGKSKRNVLLSDSFFVSLMAAIGWSRSDQTANPLVEIRQSGLIDLLKTSTLSDPMVLEDPTRGLNNVTLSIKSSIGKIRRNMIYHAWKQYFINGARDPRYPIDWEEGKRMS